MRVRLIASLGYKSSKSTEVNIDPEDIEDFTPEQIRDYLWARADEYAVEQVESWYEIVEEE